MSDIDDLLDAIVGDREGASPCLVELGSAIKGRGRRSTGYYWSTGRVFATVQDQKLRIERRYGPTYSSERGGDGLTLSTRALAALEAAVLHWSKQRDRWAAFKFSTSGYPAGFGGEWIYAPPGRRAKWEQLGKHTAMERQGQEPGGEDEERPVSRSTVLPHGVRIAAKIWRVGAIRGPKEGSQIGLCYELGDGLVLKAQRYDALVERGDAEGVYLEPGDEAFISALLKLPAFGTSTAAKYRSPQPGHPSPGGASSAALRSGRGRGRGPC